MSTRSRGGRPSLVPGTPATYPIHVRVTPEIAQKLARVAAENATTRAGVIREAVNEYVSDYCERVVFPLSPFDRSCQ